MRYAIKQARAASPLELVDGIPAHHWQGWLIEKWLPRSGYHGVALRCSPETAEWESPDLPCSSHGP